MSVAERPFADPRNTYVVGNDDPGAFDKRFVGQPGTHTEQRCCDDQAPYVRKLAYVSSFVLTRGRAPSSAAELDAYARSQGELFPDELWCKACSLALEDLRDDVDWASLVRAVAQIASYIPVFGTAVAFVLNVAVSLAEGEDISDVVLDGVSGALPGQPFSRSAFNYARAVATGDPFDESLVELLPISQDQKGYVRSAVQVFKDVAAGHPIGDVGLDAIRRQLPPPGQRAMDLARAVASGQDVGDAALNAVGRELVLAGQAAADNFVAQAGYRELLNQVDPDLAAAIQTGLAIAEAQIAQGHRTRPNFATPRVTTTTTMRLASASLAAMPRTSLTTTMDTSARYGTARPEFAKPQEAAKIVNAIQQQAVGGDVNAILAQQALDRATRALARLPWVDYYNGLP